MSCNREYLYILSVVKLLLFSQIIEEPHFPHLLTCEAYFDVTHGIFVMSRECQDFQVTFVSSFLPWVSVQMQVSQNLRKITFNCLSYLTNCYVLSFGNNDM